MNIMTRGDSQLLILLVTVSVSPHSPLRLPELLLGGLLGICLWGWGSPSGDPNPLITGVGELWAGMLCAHFCPFSGAQGGTEALHVTGLEGALHLPGPPQKSGKEGPPLPGGRGQSLVKPSL